MARPLDGGELIDPLGGRADLEARTLRVLGPEAYERDPLRAAAPAAPRRGARLRAGRRDRAAHARRRAARGRGRRRARLRGAAPAGDRATASLAGLALADRARRCSRAVLPELADAARRRAERLPPPRRLRPHARGAGAADRARGGSTERVRPGAPARRARARRAARRRADPRPGAALRRAAARHRQAGHARRAARTGASRSWATTRVGEQMVGDLCRRLRTSERFARFVGGAHPPPPRARLPRARAPARPAPASTATCAAPRPWRSRSPCCRAPTGSPPGAARPTRRPPRTSSWRGS